MPSRASFDMPLLPTKLRFNMCSEQLPNVLHQQCPICEESLINVGLFIQHCRQKHSSSPEEIPVLASNIQQTDNNTAHWSTYNVCPGCGTDFKRKWNVEQHIAIVHSKERSFAYDQCSEAYATNGLL